LYIVILKINFKIKMAHKYIPVLLVGLAACGKANYDLDGGDLVTVGQRFVQQRQCMKCHTDNLAGSDVPEENSMAYAANLTPDHATGIGDWADEAIARAVRYGVDDKGEKLCPPMPHHDGTQMGVPAMTDLEMKAIIAYLRSIPAVSHSVMPSTCPPIKPAPLADLAVEVTPVVDMAVEPTDGGAHD
jgi:hypothetical protein